MLTSTSPSTPSPPEGDANGPTALRRAAQWWEPRRVLYNSALALTFLGLTARTWPRLKPELDTSAVLPLFVLALLANACYSAAYLVDLPVQEVRVQRERSQWRWTLWSVGTLFAMVLETYWFLDEILPPLR